MTTAAVSHELVELAHDLARAVSEHDLERLDQLLAAEFTLQGAAGQLDRIEFLEAAAGANDMSRRVVSTVANCPDTKLVLGGYSQGAAVMVNAVSKLDPSVQERVAGVVLYGNTRNKQENGKIPNFPPEKAKTYCNASDGVCGGALLVTAGHLTYTRDVKEAVSYLQTQISAQGSASSSSSRASTGTSSSSAVTTTKASSGLGGLSGWSGIFGN